MCLLVTSIDPSSFSQQNSISSCFQFQTDSTVVQFPLLNTSFYGYQVYIMNPFSFTTLKLQNLDIFPLIISNYLLSIELELQKYQCESARHEKHMDDRIIRAKNKCFGLFYFIFLFELQNNLQNGIYVIPLIKILSIKFNWLNIMNSRRCYGCDRSSSSLLTANCGHKTCFYCIRDNKSAQKCTKCCKQANNGHSMSLSPAKNRSANKSDHLKSQQTKIWQDYSPINQVNDRSFTNKNKQRQSNFSIKKSNMKNQNNALVCPEHRQPLSMFSKHSKQILCSMCLCKKSKYREDILPLKNAQQFLSKQNKVFREQARIALSDVQHAWRIVNRNRQVFQQSMQTHTQFINNYFESITDTIRNMQQNSIRYCNQYLQNKINEYAQISDDLSYLSDTLKDFRQDVRENNSLNQNAFLYTSFTVIKKTLESLSFDYIAYDNNPISLISFNEQLMKKIERQLIGFKFDLKIKESENNKNRSTSLKSMKNNKHSPSPDLAIKNKHKISIQGSSSKKHKFSLCSNGSVDYCKQQNNLYKKLLKAKYKI